MALTFVTNTHKILARSFISRNFYSHDKVHEFQTTAR